ncbi:MAG: ADP-ribosylation family protein [Myxococcota bacterium]
MSELEPGAAVSVIDGPFAGFDGQVVSVDGAAVVATLSVFGRSTEVRLGRHQVSAKPDPRAILRRRIEADSATASNLEAARFWDERIHVDATPAEDWLAWVDAERRRAEDPTGRLALAARLEAFDREFPPSAFEADPLDAEARFDDDKGRWVPVEHARDVAKAEKLAALLAGIREGAGPNGSDTDALGPDPWRVAVDRRERAATGRFGASLLGPSRDRAGGAVDPVDEADGARLRDLGERLNALFPGALPNGAVLTCVDPLPYVPSVGLVAECGLFDPDDASVNQQADLVLVRPSEVRAPDVAVARLRDAIARMMADPDRAAALARPLAETTGFPEARYDEATFAPTPADDARRARCLDAAFARFDDASARFRAVYGLRLPRHLAVFSALCASLTALERRGLASLGRRPDGVTALIAEPGLFDHTRDGLDPRLHDRFRRDPPEFVTVMFGDTDGLHYGLWYDDPAEPPSFVVHNYARDSAETWTHRCATPIAALTRELFAALEEGPPTAGVLALGVALAAFADADARALADDGPRRWADVARPPVTGGMGPALPPGSGDPRPAAEHARYAAYRAEAPDVLGWIAEARAELAAGQPAFALVLGRELHWLDADPYRAASLELLTGAYEALGRHALAEIARVHHANRDLGDVGVCRPATGWNAR